jgi:prolyl oligopeptidase
MSKLARVAVVAAFVGCTPHAETPELAPHIAPTRPGDRPPTRREPIVDVIHGERVEDPYRWLEPATDPEVAQWLRAQHTHTRHELDALPHRDALQARLRELMYVDDLSPPRRFGKRQFFARKHADKEKVVYYTRDKAGIDRVLLDPNTMAPNVSIHGVFPSRDGRLVAYKTSIDNADAATLHVMEVDTGKVRSIDRIDGARYAMPSWTPDGKAFYYTGLPTDPSIPAPELPGRAEVRLHRLGTDPRRDEIIHPALRDPTAFIGADLSRDGRFLVLTISRGFASADVWFADLKRGPAFVPLTVGAAFRTQVIAHRGTLYLHTNDGAPRFRVMAVDPAQPQREHWREVVPESPATLGDMSIFGGQLALEYLVRASSKVELRTLAGRHIRDLALPELGVVSTLVGDADDDALYYRFGSLVRAPQIWRTSIATGKTELWHEVDVPGDTSHFELEQVVYTSKDGTPITMFVVHHEDVVLDGSNPTILTGYGGFGVSMLPDFNIGALLWLEHGGVWALPNLRGGGEYGEAWHEAGKLHNKQNVFDDFIAAAQWLVDTGYTRPDKLAIRGGSNGGLLVGAVSTQRPDLFGAVVCAVPLLDMIRYHRFGAGPTWIGEYGSADDPLQFRTLLAYSPYHHVRAGVDYPPLLMLGADSDDRVDPMHARKYVAAMQAATDASTSVLLRVEQGAGHGGADGVRQAVAQGVDVHAWLFAQLDVAR